MIKAGKRLYIAVTILEVLFLAGSYIVDYFTRKKMGMARFVIYKNYAWEEKYPMVTLSYIVIIALSILTVAVVILFLRVIFLKKSQRTDRREYIMVGIMILLTLLYVCFTLACSKETQRSYYFVSALYGIAAVLQIVKAGTVLIRRRNEKSVK
ncbi:hypothetical protein [Clostridium sp. C105KSO13]|uniref:hypothetical protein n=1 Tax=Clostridium sp. C105KSO13 TaxID=1776045 RepID=UPI0007405BEE|nr:hypothetical protein [Clostridium sp. C105KSO13]CUX31262.1 hypothetical protein BN3456_01311 [Clostridium sp. C105KSO13]